MNTIKDLVQALNIPKDVLEKADRFLTALLGPSVSETGELIADKVRRRRFRNQVHILIEARELLAEAGIKFKPMGLKTLVPLIEASSLEENPGIQQMWANLIANAVKCSSRAGLHAICITVLRSISPFEAKVLQKVMQDYHAKRPELIASLREWNKDRTDIYADSLFWRPEKLFRRVQVPKEDINLLLDNLLRLNVLRYEVPEIVDGENRFPKYVHLTDLGLAVLKEIMAFDGKYPDQNRIEIATIAKSTS